MNFIPHPLAAGIEQATSSLAQGLVERTKKFQEREKLKKSGNLFEEILQEKGAPSSLNDILTFQTEFINRGGDENILKNVLSQAQPYLKAQAQMNSLNDLLNQYNATASDGSFSSIDTLDIEADEDITGSPQSRNMPDEFILKASALNPTAARILQDQKNAARKEDLQFQKGSFERNKKYLEKLDEFDANSTKQEIALKQMESALEGNDFNAYRNIVADFTGLDFIRNSSSQIVNSANKEFLVSTLSELTGRPNQFIEQTLLKALLNPQYTSEANSLIYKGIKGSFDLKRKEREIALGIEESYAKKGKEVPRNFQSIVRKKMKPEVESFMQQYESDLQVLNQKIENKPTRFKKVPSGTELPRGIYEKIRASVDSKEAAINLARSLGYDI